MTSPIQRLLDEMGWDAGSPRHKYFEAALKLAGLELVERAKSQTNAQPQPTQEHVKIEHPHRPAEADYEYSDLIRRIKSQGGDGVVVGILMQYAFAAPPQGSYAGSLWALAEWVNERLVIPALSRPQLSRDGGVK